jgi:DNA-binding transcriptional regulator YiaG
MSHTTVSCIQTKPSDLKSLTFDGFGCLITPELTGADVVDFRKKVRMTQEEFSFFFEIPIETLNLWETEIIKPDISIAKLFDKKNALQNSSKIISSIEYRDDILMAA